MIYITAMRVRSLTDRNLGINVFVHHDPKPVPQDPLRVSQEGVTAIKGADWVEIKAGGNSVEAYLDLVLDDDVYARSNIDDAVKGVESVLRQGSRNPAAVLVNLGKKHSIHVVYSVNVGLEDQASKLRVLNDLREKVRRCLERSEERIFAAMGQRAASGA